MHKCDNPICCNPNHLEPGSIKDNNIDCNEKDRRNLPKGEDHHRAVFTNEEIAKILKMRDEGQSATQIAAAMQKNRSTVKSLLFRNRKSTEPRVVTSPEEIAKIFEMRQSGHTAKAIAETMHKNLSTVKSILQRKQ